MFSATIRRTLFGMAALLAASASAIAGPTTLICDTGLPLDLGPTTVDLNEGQGTVTLHIPGQRYPGPPQGHTIGPLPATFGAESITFTDTSNHTDDTYVINRLSGTIAYTQADQQTHETAGYANWTCHVGAKQF